MINLLTFKASPKPASQFYGVHETIGVILLIRAGSTDEAEALVYTISEPDSYDYSDPISRVQLPQVFAEVWPKMPEFGHMYGEAETEGHSVVFSVDVNSFDQLNSMIKQFSQ